MNFKKIISVMAIAIFSTSSYGESILMQDNDPSVILIPPHKSPGQQSASVNYNQVTTQLKVAFGANGGKVEIYRNGSLVERANGEARTRQDYTLSNYGRGTYIVVVSVGNTVVYCDCIMVE